MSLLQIQPWEARLLNAAQEALNSQTVSHRLTESNQQALEAAYAYCDALTQQHSRTFYVASGLLPYEKRRGARALYAFCRVTDDIVDVQHTGNEKKKQALDEWRACTLADHPYACLDAPVALAWADTQARFNIPRGYAQQLIDGCARDIQQTRYKTFAELAEYSYGVASTVGLMAMHIIGFSDTDAIPYAVRLGVALQITNILRDVKEDWRNGRIYLPQQEMEAFGVDEETIATGAVTPSWRAFMRFQIERNRQLYAESLPGIAKLEANGRFAIAAAAKLYEAILKDIEAHDYDVFSRRASVSKLGKISRLPAIWWQARFAKAH